MKNNDLVVIGSGLSGLLTACVAAGKGKKVTVLSYGAGTLTIGGGIVDFIGYDDNAQPVKNPLAALNEINPEHPYAKVGKAVASAAFNDFKKITENEGYAYLGDVKKNRWVPTAVGSFKPTCLVPKTMDTDALKSAKEVLVVGVNGLKDFYAKLVAKNLQEFYGEAKKVTFVNVGLDLTNGRDISCMDVARYLDTKEGQTEFADKLKATAKPGMVLIVPPVLGTKPDYKVLNTLEQGLSCRFVESAAVPPSVTGYRLWTMMTNYAKKLGVNIVEKAKVVSAHVENGECVYVETEGFDRKRKYYAKSFILANGGVYGGGLEAQIGKMIEPIFGFDIPAPADQVQWSNKDLISNKKQLFALMGVRVNTGLVPVDEQDTEVVKNVKVVGRSLAGYDFCFEKSGNGVAIATAYKAALSL